ncbi:hypothetical protein ACEPPN_002082 [Leptodophora sp. 'Broadleaf-Isolate-01']
MAEVDVAEALLDSTLHGDCVRAVGGQESALVTWNVAIIETKILLDEDFIVERWLNK